MKIEILNKAIEMENSHESIKWLLEEIDDILKEPERVFLGMNIDGTEVYEDYYNYISERLDSIKFIIVEIRTTKEMILDTLNTTVEYLNRALPEIENLAGGFYNTPNTGTWERFRQFLEGIKWLNSTISFFDNNSNLYDGLNEYVSYAKRLPDIFRELIQAYKSSDMILMADLLSYEIIPLLQSMKDSASKIAARGVL